MLKQTFLHISGIGEKTERKIWDLGIREWSEFKLPYPESLLIKAKQIELYLKESIEQIENRNPNYFSRRLPLDQSWRIFPEFRETTVYLDIETTGLDFYNEITTIALYDGKSVAWYVNGRNLDDFKKDIFKYNVIVSYNGKSFDAPFIENYFSMKLDHVHIDLRYVLASLGYRGGLKSCEEQLGIDRGDIKGIDGYFAVLLWNEYKSNKNTRALDTLLAYNIEDVVNLEQLMVIAYNLKLKNTPFYPEQQLAVPLRPEIPFKPDRTTIEMIHRGFKTVRWKNNRSYNR